MKFPLSLAFAFALAACGSSPNDESTGNKAQDSAAVPLEPAAPSPIGSVNQAASDDSTGGGADHEKLAELIPEDLHGRWGLVEGDCTSNRGDAKGLLIVGAGDLRFYESRATVTKVIEQTPQRLTADFAFTGEGMEWQRRMTLERQAGHLVRTEQGEDAIPGPLRYQQCPL